MFQAKKAHNKLKRHKKRCLAIILALCMAMGMLPFFLATAEAAGTGVADRLNALRDKYPDGHYWNHYVSQAGQDSGLLPTWDATYADCVSTTPCAHHNDGYTGNYVGLYDCNRFDGGSQCWGFARKVFFDVFGVKCSSLTKNYDIANVQVGDYVRFGTDNFGHSFIVLEKKGDEVTALECNYGGRCIIKWTRSQNLRGYLNIGTSSSPNYASFNYSIHAPNYNEINNSPVTGSPMPDDPGHRPISDGDYFIVSAVEGNRFNPGSKCLTFDGLPAANNTNGANAILKQVYGDEGHLFTVTWLGNGFYKIKLKDSQHQNLDVQGGYQHRDANVWSWGDYDEYDIKDFPNTEQWYINETNDGNGYTIQSKCSGFYLDVVDGKTDNGTNIRLWDGNGSNAQRWYFIPWGGDSSAEPAIADGEYHIMAQNADGMVMSLQGNERVNGTKIVMEPEQESYMNTFQVRWLGNGYYEIVNLYSGRSLDAEDAASKLGTDISLYDYDPDHRYNQTWLIRPCDDGSDAFYIISKANGLYIDFDFDNGIAQGKKINLWCEDGGNAQKWKFVPYISPESVSLSADNLTLCVGETATLRAKIKPDNAMDQSLTWGYNNRDGVITVEEYGQADEFILTANAVGKIAISVWVANSKKAVCQVTVREHSFGAAWKSDTENHWKECDCGEKTEESVHAFAWKIDKEPTEEAAGVKHEECSVCGFKRSENTVIDKLPPSCVHSFGAAWKSDGENHWKECDCGEKSTESAHTFVWKIDKEATEEAAGVKHEECSVCGFKRSENTVIDKLPPSCVHSFGAAWKSDGENHWKECDCGEKSTESAHAFVWKIDKAPTEEAAGVKHEECSVCGFKRSENTAIDKLPPSCVHSFGAAWKSDGENHWKECACGEKTEESAHAFAWKIDKAPTEEAEGVKHEECSVCGFKRSENTAIDKLPPSHVHSFGTGWKSDAEKHWKECSCGEKTEESGHAFAWKIDKEPTEEVTGIKHEECSVCGFRRNENTAMDKLPPSGRNQPEGNAPFIKGENSKMGWDVIRDTMEKTEAGKTVSVDMNGAAVVPGSVLNDIKTKGITGTFEMGNGIIWSVNGQSFTADRTEDINFSVTVRTENIPAELVDSIANGRTATQISLSHDGEFGCTAVLTVNLGSGNAGLMAKLYYYNKISNELEDAGSDRIAGDGTAVFAFTHASDYVIMVGEERKTDGSPENPAESQQPETSGEETDDSDEERVGSDTEDDVRISGGTPLSPATGEGTLCLQWILAVIVSAVALCIGLVILKRKKRRNR